MDNGLPKARVLEPNKCAGWEWLSWPDLLEWARPQLKALDRERPTPVPLRASHVAGLKEARTLFSPLISLVSQRPSSAPSPTCPGSTTGHLALHCPALQPYKAQSTCRTCLSDTLKPKSIASPDNHHRQKLSTLSFYHVRQGLSSYLNRRGGFVVT